MKHILYFFVWSNCRCSAAGRLDESASSTRLSSMSFSRQLPLQRAATSCSRQAQAPTSRCLAFPKASMPSTYTPSACPKASAWRVRWTRSGVRPRQAQPCASTSGTSASGHSQSRWTSCTRCSVRWRRWITSGSWSTTSTRGCESGIPWKSATLSWCCSYIRWAKRSSFLSFGWVLLNMKIIDTAKFILTHLLIDSMDFEIQLDSIRFKIVLILYWSLYGST